VFTQAFLPQEIGLSSVLREMSAIHKTLLCRGSTLKMLQPSTLWRLTDNSAVWVNCSNEAGLADFGVSAGAES
jgi:hypothetical protein